MSQPHGPAELAAPGPWARFRQAHLFDYTPAATRLFVALVGAGALAAAWALVRLAMAPAADIGAAVLGGALVMLAAMFALQIPRTSYSLSVADVFTFTILATLGAPAAVLAAGVEGLVGTLRTSRRMSSWLSSPAVSMAAMAVAGNLYGVLHPALVAAGAGPEVATLAALCAVSTVPLVLTVLSLLSVLTLKRGLPLRPLEWLAESAWMAAIALLSAFVAGLVHLNARRFGPVVIGVGVVVAFGLVLLVRVTLQRREAERLAQEQRLAQAQREAELSRQRFSAAFTHAAIGMAIVTPAGAVLQVNQALCSLLGRNPEDLVGQPFGQLLQAGDDDLLRRQAAELLARPDGALSTELRCRARDGSERWVALHCSHYEDPGSAGRCLIYQLHDITSRRLAESRLQHIAYHDGLTDLANRSCFQQRLEVSVERTRLDLQARFAVMFLDLDRFKIVNDSLGHIAGNELLREVAQRLRACVRPNDLVARLGGDEFAVLLDGLGAVDDGLRLAERVLHSLMQPVSIDGTEVLPGASLGITFSDLGYRTADEVLRDADLAMYEAKAAGRGRVVLFDSSMHERVAEKLALEADLRHAIGEGQLSVQFQPLYELDPYRLYGFEALARWVHPTRGPVSPAVFIALAEESGHIEALTDWVIDHASARLAEWRLLGPGAEHLGMHVNISGRDLARAGLAPHVKDALLRHGLPGSALTLEITETTLMGRLEVALQTMEALREVGVRFSIDDFGTGYSSLSYLSRLPIDSLKIDRSFVMGLHEKPQNVEIVNAVLNLGLSLGRKVIAEGIETPEQLAVLRRIGVPIGQGYLLSRPLRAEQVPDLLALPAPAL